MGPFLVKFFRDRKILDSFLDGMFWCNTPEYYRLEDASGIGDKYESCTHSYRASRDGEGASIEINGIQIGTLTESTMYSYSTKDRWMHCWFEWTLPETDEECVLLVKNVNRMISEFGSLYVVLLRKDVQQLVSRVAALTELKVNAGTVSYSPNREDWNSLCKSLSYAYQREFRFLVGDCSTKETSPQKLYYENGFRDIVLDNPPISMKDAETNELLFELTPDGCRTSLK